MTALEKTWVEQLPSTPFSDLVDIQIRTFDRIGKMPQQPFFTCSEYDKALRVLIKRSKVKIAQARVCYDAIMAKAKLDLLEERRIATGEKHEVLADEASIGRMVQARTSG